MLLELNGISKSYGIPGESSHQAVLNNLTLDISAGETLAILGPSGSGKSTLLNIIGTLDYPDSGSFLFKGRTITDMGQKDLDNFRNREIGFVFQFHHLLPQCNVMENVLIPTLVGKENPRVKAALAEELLNRVGMWNHRHKKPGQLSGGECQRVAVVRAMINSPALLLADEPTGALDRKNVDSISELLLKLNIEDGISLVLVTHSESLAASMGTIYELSEGQLHKK